MGLLKKKKLSEVQKWDTNLKLCRGHTLIVLVTDKSKCEALSEGAAWAKSSPTPGLGQARISTSPVPPIPELM